MNDRVAGASRWLRRSHAARRSEAGPRSLRSHVLCAGARRGAAPGAGGGRRPAHARRHRARRHPHPGEPLVRPLLRHAIAACAGFGDQSRCAAAARSSRSRVPRAGYGGHLLPVPPRHDDDGECTNDITHDWGPQHRAGTTARMDGFVKVHLDRRRRRERRRRRWATTRATDLPFYYALADAFTLCDGYHCSVHRPDRPEPALLDVGTARSGRAATAGRCWRRSRPTRRASTASFTLDDDARAAPGARESAGRSTTSPDGDFGDNVLAVLQALPDEPDAGRTRRSTPTFPDDFLADLRHGHAAAGLVGPTDARPRASIRRLPRRRTARSWRPDRAERARRPTRGLGEDRAVHHLRRERRLLRPRAAADAAGGHAGRVRHGATRCPPTRRGSAARSAWASACRCWSSRRSPAAASSARTRSTTPRCCGSSRRASAPRSRTSSAWRRAAVGDLTSAFNFAAADQTLADVAEPVSERPATDQRQLHRPPGAYPVPPNQMPSQEPGNCSERASVMGCGRGPRSECAAARPAVYFALVRNVAAMSSSPWSAAPCRGVRESRIGPAGRDRARARPPRPAPRPWQPARA